MPGIAIVEAESLQSIEVSVGLEQQGPLFPFPISSILCSISITLPTQPDNVNTHMIELLAYSLATLQCSLHEAAKLLF